MKGYVRWWLKDRGFGFLRGDDGLDYFVHYSNIEKNASGRSDLTPNDLVEFESEKNYKGLKAVAVKPLIK
jgi:CspA family cold shock protein